MDRLQGELRTSYPILNIDIVGINEFGQNPAGANEAMTANRTTPWLQDGDGNGNQRSDVWYDSWNVTYRDVIIVDGRNETVDVYNLTSNDLGVAANYATMRDKLIDAAMTEQKPWQNHRDRFDVNDDGFVVPGDVLRMINEINDNGPLKLPPPTGTTLTQPFWDCNGDNFFSPVDILQVINFLEGVAAEGESAGGTAVATAGAAPLIAQPQLSNESESLVTSVVVAEPEILAEPEFRVQEVTTIQAAPPVTSTDDRFRPTESMEDDFWANYWPAS